MTFQLQEVFHEASRKSPLRYWELPSRDRSPYDGTIAKSNRIHREDPSLSPGDINGLVFYITGPLWKDIGAMSIVGSAGLYGCHCLPQYSHYNMSRWVWAVWRYFVSIHNI